MWPFNSGCDHEWNRYDERPEVTIESERTVADDFDGWIGTAELVVRQDEGIQCSHCYERRIVDETVIKREELCAVDIDYDEVRDE